MESDAAFLEHHPSFGYVTTRTTTIDGGTPTTTTLNYSGNNDLTSEVTTTGQTSNARTYTLSSSGLRTRVVTTPEATDTLGTADQRYNAEGRAVSVTVATDMPAGGWVPRRWETHALENRYDAAGDLVLSARARVIEYIGTESSGQLTNQTQIDTKTVTSVSVNGQVQFLHAMIHGSGFGVGPVLAFFDYKPYSKLETRNQDESFSLADGTAFDDPKWSTITNLASWQPLSVSGTMPLEAPTAPLSTTVRVDPLAVTAPGSSAPSAADPTTVTAPTPSTTQNQQSTSSSTVFSSNTSLPTNADVSSPSFGVQSYNLFNPNQPSQTPSTTQPTTQTPSSTVSSSFNSSMALEAPVSVLPPAIINLNTAAVSQPSSVMPSVDPTTITAPGSSVPGVGPNPSSNPGGVTPPTASNPNQPVVPPVNGPVTGVKPPTSSSEPTVTPQGITKTYCSNPCSEEEPSSLSGQAYTTSKQTSQATSGPAHHIVEMAEQALMRAAAKYGSKAVALANFLIHVLGDSDLDAPSKSVVLSRWAEEFDRGPGVLEPPPIPVTPPAPTVPRPPVSPQPVAAPVTLLGLIGQIAGALIATLLLTGDSQRNTLPYYTSEGQRGGCKGFTQEEVLSAAANAAATIGKVVQVGSTPMSPLGRSISLENPDIRKRDNVAVGYYFSGPTLLDTRLALSGAGNAPGGTGVTDVLNKGNKYSSGCKNGVITLKLPNKASVQIPCLANDTPKYFNSIGLTNTNDKLNYQHTEPKLLAHHFENSSKGESLAGTNRIIIVTYREPCVGCEDTINRYENLTGVNICVIWFRPEDKK